MPYSAIELAKYIISLINERGEAISNLKLQKILYYVQGEFLRTFNDMAFFEDIVAWKHGPVVSEVYYEFNKYSARPITEEYNLESLIDIPQEEQRVIENVLDQYLQISAWDLVRLTHEEGPWQRAYEEYRNNIITRQMLEEFFVN